MAAGLEISHKSRRGRQIAEGGRASKRQATPTMNGTRRDRATDLRGRRWTIGSSRPVRFPAWRLWVDERVRLDDAVLDVLAGLDLAVVALDMRAQAEEDIVPVIFTKDELPYGQGFSVSVGAARERLRDAEQQVVLNAFPIYVAGFDRCLGAVIKMMRQLGIDTQEPGTADTGISGKVRYLRAAADLVLKPESEALWSLLVTIRNAVVHNGASEKSVAVAWEACAGIGAGEDAQALWSRLAERPLPVSVTGRRLRFSDREVVGCQRVLDGIAIDLAEKLRARISSLDWARLVAATEGPKQPWVLNNPGLNVRKLRGWCSGGWGVTIDEATAREALANPL